MERIFLTLKEMLRFEINGHTNTPLGWIPVECEAEVAKHAKMYRTEGGDWIICTQTETVEREKDGKTTLVEVSAPFAFRRFQEEIKKEVGNGDITKLALKNIINKLTFNT